MMYHSKTPQKYYQFPDGFIPAEGILQLFTSNGKHLLADEASIKTFEISKGEAQKLLSAELTSFVDKFLHGFKSKTQPAPPHEVEENDKNHVNTEPLSAKMKEGVDFISDISGMIKALVTVAATEDEKELAATRLKMSEFRNRLKDRGIHVNEEVDDLPFTLKEKYRNEGKTLNLQKGVAEFKSATEKLGLTLKDILEAIKSKENPQGKEPQ